MDCQADVANVANVAADVIRDGGIKVWALAETYWVSTQAIY